MQTPNRLPVLLLLPLLTGDATFANPATPPILVTNVRCTGGTNLTLTLQAWPGDYVFQTSAQWSGGWSNEAFASVGREGVATTGIPTQDRDVLFLRATGLTPSDGVGCLAQFQTLGSTFQPEVRCDAGSPTGFAWIWSDGTTSGDWPVATKDFGSTGVRMQGLRIDPANVVTSINLGFDGADGGWSTPLSRRAAQHVSAVRFPYPLASLRYWASSYCPITNTLDFTGFAALEAIECFNCTPLQHVVVTNLPALKRACFEDCDLRELDLSGNPNLEDLRGAMNAYTNIVVGRGTGPRVWHWCVRDNPQLTQSFRDIMTNFFSLRELYIWNDNQHGEFKVGSTNLVDLQAANNQFTAADLAGQSNLWTCSFENNALSNVILTGCSGLRYLNLRNNALTTNALDSILAELDATAVSLIQADLSGNPQYPSAMGYAHFTNLFQRGAAVSVDWPPSNDGSNNVPGGLSAITFITTSRQPHMEIQTGNGTATNILWHWGDGTTTVGARIASHDFGSAGTFINYVEVGPPGGVTYFGAQQGWTGQGIKGVYGVTNFPSLNFLYLYQENLTDLSIAGCSNLVQLHFADNPVPVDVCDQWFIDLDQAVTGPVSDADFYYPASRRSARSDAAWTNLVNKGYAMHPF